MPTASRTIYMASCHVASLGGPRFVPSQHAMCAHTRLQLLARTMGYRTTQSRAIHQYRQKPYESQTRSFLQPIPRGSRSTCKGRRIDRKHGERAALDPWATMPACPPRPGIAGPEDSISIGLQPDRSARPPDARPATGRRGQGDSSCRPPGTPWQSPGGLYAPPLRSGRLGPMEKPAPARPAPCPAGGRDPRRSPRRPRGDVQG
jgi:hypothetical protein